MSNSQLHVIFLTNEHVPKQIAKMSLDTEGLGSVENAVKSVKEQFFSQFGVKESLVTTVFYVEESDDEDIVGEMTVES